ncbi:magnesium chelatase [Thermoplasmatales archaeon SW_10_69_26]|nr:MAG: magnesium chelatase [Thermoplasmatales archaeon SW_10_69_26]
MKRVARKCTQIRETVNDVFVGHPDTVEKLLAAALANGHVLFEDYPGLGKTLLVKVFAQAVGCEFDRIQFTPDLLPADIVGTNIYNPKTGEFQLEKGPIFANVVLADEINRAPPKTQSALLESMEERQVTIEGDTMEIPSPFFVLATQNPIEQEGTYPLPEAQMDRFLVRLQMGYPDSLDDESEIMRRRIDWSKNDPSGDVEPVISMQTFQRLQRVVEDKIFVHEAIIEYIARIVRTARAHEAVDVGPSPRGDLALLRLSRALAMTRGRDYVTPDDVKDLAVDALAHRIVLDMEHVIEGTEDADVVEAAIGDVEPPTAYSRGEA